MYKHVFVAGTFDGLHRGHEALLARAFAQGEKVTVGVTSDAFVQSYKSPYGEHIRLISAADRENMISSFANRRDRVTAWIKRNGWEARGAILTIDDPYEPAASSNQWDAIVVTAETKARAQRINAMRQSRGLPAMAVLEVSVEQAEDNRPISSTRIRQGDIDADGKLVLPDALRPELQAPWGTLLVDGAIGRSFRRHEWKVIISVGDMTTKTLIEEGITPSLAIIDLRVGRKPYQPLEAYYFDPSARTVGVKSGPGFIATQAIEEIIAWTHRQDAEVLVVDGEEDLLALPVFIHAPLRSVVYYGQPKVAGGTEGIVEVTITREIQEKASKLLDRFTR